MKNAALKNVTKVVVSVGVLSAIALGASAAPQTVVFEFGDGEISGGWARDYGFFGGFGNDGKQIVETRVYIDFEPTNGFDAADFFSGFLVPVILDDPGNTEFMGLLGEEMGWSGTDGRKTYELVTDAFNGIVRPGRFGWELYGANDLDPSISGIFRNNSRIEFDLVPTPGALAVLGLGGLMAGRRRR